VVDSSVVGLMLKVAFYAMVALVLPVYIIGKRKETCSSREQEVPCLEVPQRIPEHQRDTDTEKTSTRKAMSLAGLIIALMLGSVFVLGIVDEVSITPPVGSSVSYMPSLFDLEGLFSFSRGNDYFSVRIWDAGPDTALAEVYSSSTGSSRCIAYLIGRTLRLVFLDLSELTFQVKTRSTLVADSGLQLDRT